MDNTKSMIDFEKLVFEEFHNWFLKSSMIDIFHFPFSVFEIAIEINTIISKMENGKIYNDKTMKNEKRVQTWKMENWKIDSGTRDPEQTGGGVFFNCFQRLQHYHAKKRQTILFLFCFAKL